ncbi:peptide/nickel transport system permease protein [Tindallia magadiensis]|uniref:Peptide/nickel transport system permease protein n=1 Tax=Tindallia magadiensis TaxID=69895 RepID=A0A1I3GR53_9FIRM|nr:ABC transporter permease [Tindallia magadiensis]SFI25893.1 peptide/nickel transport system permease protein [Tindallia magadiensis]
MNKEFLVKLFQMFVVLLCASFITFTLSYFSPGDPAERRLMAMDMVPSEEALERTREEMGLNQPFLFQYAGWLSGLIRGDMGDSYHFRQPVSEIMLNRMSRTFLLASYALGLTLITSIPLGMLAAIKRNGMIDYIIRFTTFIALSVPGFWLGLMLMYVIAVRYRLLPIMPEGGIKDYILPVLTLSIPLIGRYIRLVRASVLEELTMDYVVSAKARGIPEMKILICHVLPNTLPGLITLIGMTVAALLGGTVIVEHLFMRPGLGTMVLQAVNHRDYPLLQGFVVLMVFVYVTISYVVDGVIRVLDPRALSKDRKEGTM